MTMGVKDHRANAFIERFETCNQETLHDVSIEIKTESKKRENAKFSREPYRTTQCLICGSRHSQRMNNA